MTDDDLEEYQNAVKKHALARRKWEREKDRNNVLRAKLEESDARKMELSVEWESACSVLDAINQKYTRR